MGIMVAMNSQAISKADPRDSKLKSSKTISLVNSTAYPETGSRNSGKKIDTQQGSNLQ